MANTLQLLLRGKGAHADTVGCVSGMNPEIAGQRIPGIEHTIWQLLVHMNYWMDYELHSIAGPEVPYPEHAAVSWPNADGPASAFALTDEAGRFADQIKQLSDLASRLNDDQLRSRVVHPAKLETVEDVLWQMVAHNSYHIGQVATLRRAFGAWPPAEGGDTW
jgi:uncharacterized damage-inducible protein DinB